jgi:hypothetical protein
MVNLTPEQRRAIFIKKNLLSSQGTRVSTVSDPEIGRKAGLRYLEAVSKNQPFTKRMIAEEYGTTENTVGKWAKLESGRTETPLHRAKRFGRVR